MRQHYRIAQYKQRYTDALAQQKEQAQVEDVRSQTAMRNAQASWFNQRPTIEARKADAQALTRQQAAIRTEIKNRLQNPRPFDANDPYDGNLQARAQAAGVGFDPTGFGDFKNPLTIEVVDPRDPSETTKTREVYNRATRRFEPLTNDGQPVKTGYTQPVNPQTGMTPAQTRSANDRRAARDARIAGQIAQATTTNNAIDGSLRQIGEEIAATQDQIDQLVRDNKGQIPTGLSDGKDEYNRAVQHLQALQREQRALQVRRRAAPQHTAPLGRGAYAGQRFSRSQLPEIQRRLGAASPAEAQRIVETQGGVIVDQ